MLLNHITLGHQSRPLGRGWQRSDYNRRLAAGTGGMARRGKALRRPRRAGSWSWASGWQNPPLKGSNSRENVALKAFHYFSLRWQLSELERLGRVR